MANHTLEQTSTGAATFDVLNSLMVMRRAPIAVILVLALLPTPAGASATQARRQLPVKCAPRSHVLLADAQAQVYATFEGSPKTLFIRGCAYGQQRSFFITACNYGEGAVVCADSHVTMVDALIAYENADVNSGKYPNLETNVAERYVVVRNLRTGQVLHKMPTGTPLKPKPNYDGVGPIVGLVLKSDGSVAWIAEDYARSAEPNGTGAPYFDVYAADNAGTRLLASGTSVDPSSLSLSVGSIDVGGIRRPIVGSTLYWTQGGVPFSTTLD